LKNYQALLEDKLTQPRNIRNIKQNLVIF